MRRSLLLLDVLLALTVALFCLCVVMVLRERNVFHDTCRTACGPEAVLLCDRVSAPAGTLASCVAPGAPDGVRHVLVKEKAP